MSFIKQIVTLCFLLLLFQSPLSRLDLPLGLASYFGYLDELLAIALFVVLLVRAGSRGVPRRYFKDVILFMGFLLVGFVGTATNNLQPISAVIEDVIACSKFLIVLYGFISLLRDNHAGEILERLEKISRALIVLFFILALIDEILPGFIFSGDKIMSILYNLSAKRIE